MSKLVSTENKKTDNRTDKIKLYSIGAVVILIGILVIVKFKQNTNLCQTEEISCFRHIILNKDYY